MPLLDGLDRVVDPHYLPPTPPRLDACATVYLDLETTGLKWWAGDRPIGLSIRTPEGDGWYLPVGHAGGNLDEARVKDWARRELRDKHIVNVNTRFDGHMLREWGIDLEAQGCTFSDIQHDVALLDDRRRRFNLEVLGQEFLGRGKKADGIDPTKMRYYHASEVEAYALEDTALVRDLDRLLAPRIHAEDLARVKALECALIPVVMEMERNAAPIDVALLKAWRAEVQQQYQRALYTIMRDEGITFNPDSSKDWEKLFTKLGLPITERTERGAPSFTDATLKKIDHRVVQLAYRAGKLADLLSKYLRKYDETIGADGLLRYALHQLRAEEGGTISGRFSSSGIKIGGEDIGGNIQQVMAVEKQQGVYGDDFIIRDLFVPPAGRYWLTADAKQIEYRLFAHYARSPSIIEAYQRDPDLSFHKHVHALLRVYKPDLQYKALKNLNFAKIYGAGLIKLAVMMEFITESEGDAIRERCRLDHVPYRRHPALATVLEIDAIYRRELPEVQPLLDAASKTAEQRGYVRTILGRRMRFPEKSRLHKALNGVIQGSAADIMKLKLVELHRERAYTGLTLRFTVHDEVDGDVADELAAARVEEVLNRPLDLGLRVPILWDVQYGRSWGRAAPLSKRMADYNMRVKDPSRGDREGA